MSTNATIISPDQPNVYDVISSVSSLEKQAIVRPNNPPPGIAGFLFNIEEENAVSLQSQISQHYVEDNTTVADQIALAPREYTVRGLVAELVNTKTSPNAATAPVQQSLPIQPLASPTPRFSMAQVFAASQTLARALAPGSEQIVNIARALSSDPATVTSQIAEVQRNLMIRVGLGEEAAKAMALGKFLMAATKSSAVPARAKSSLKSALGQPPPSLYNVYANKSGNSPYQTAQARACAYFDQLWSSRQLFTVETPWGFLTNMAILRMGVVQDDQSKYRSTFSITFQQIRIAGAASVTVGQLAGRLNQQQAATTDDGNAGQKELTLAQRQQIIQQMRFKP